jgi:glycosyltransferase involved in cell wall biosynthesis
MNQEPLFVIVVPTYNRVELLIRSLKSIENQEYKNWKCVVVNDGSTDDTDHKVLDYIQGKDNFSYIKQENQGVNAARNAGIDLIQQSIVDCYYIFIDDDDYLSEQCLIKAQAMIREHVGYKWFGYNCINIENKNKVSKIRQYGENNYIKGLMFGNDWRGDITSFIHSSIIGDLRFCKEIKNGEEWYFWAQLSITNNVFILDEPGSFKDYLPAGLTKSGFNRDKAIQVLLLKLRILSPIVGERKMIHQIVTLAKNYYQSGQKKEARVFLKKAFQLSPLYLRQYTHWIKHLFY